MTPPDGDDDGQLPCSARRAAWPSASRTRSMNAGYDSAYSSSCAPDAQRPVAFSKTSWKSRAAIAPLPSSSRSSSESASGTAA